MASVLKKIQKFEEQERRRQEFFREFKLVTITEASGRKVTVKVRREEPIAYPCVGDRGYRHKIVVQDFGFNSALCVRVCKYCGWQIGEPFERLSNSGTTKTKRNFLPRTNGGCVIDFKNRRVEKT